MQNKEPIYAGFFVRMAAFIIDNIIVWCGLLLIRIPFGIMSLSSPDNFLVKDLIFQYSVIDIVLYLAGCAYFILMTYYSGSTVGKRVMHIKVVSSEDRNLTFFEVAFRETIGRYLAGIIVDAGYLMVGVDKDKRGFHDILADTRVVYEHPKPQYVTPVQPRPVSRPVYHPGTGMVQPGGGIPGNGVSQNGQVNMPGNGVSQNGQMNMPGNGMPQNGQMNMHGNSMPPQPPFNQGASMYGDNPGYRDTLTRDVPMPNRTGYSGESRMQPSQNSSLESRLENQMWDLPGNQTESQMPESQSEFRETGDGYRDSSS